MMDVKFLSFFNEVAQDNFVSVAKQNLLFQAQIRTMEDQLKVVPELQKKTEELVAVKAEVQKFLHENNDLKNHLNQKNAFIENSTKVDTDRHRLQTAVNTQAKEISSMKQIIEDLKSDLEKEKNYITQLEDMIPNSKRKKLGLPSVEEKRKEEESVETKNDENTLEIVASGGSF